MRHCQEKLAKALGGTFNVVVAEAEPQRVGATLWNPFREISLEAVQRLLHLRGRDVAVAQQVGLHLLQRNILIFPTDS